MPDNPTPTHLPSQLVLTGPGGALPLPRATVEALAEFFVGWLDLVEPDPDSEEDDDAGGNVTDEPHDGWTEDGE